jgi:hypothetical protein
MISRTKWITGLVALSLAAGIFASPVLAGQAGKGPLKVFILAGQSNMEGAGAIKGNPRSGGKGSLEYIVKDPKTAARTKHIIDKDGKWVVRDDVWIWYFDRKGGLTAGYGSSKRSIGPEFSSATRWARRWTIRCS